MTITTKKTASNASTASTASASPKPASPKPADKKLAERTKYEGAERRVHKIYVTQNTEYHVRRGVCVAVKPRQEPEWTATHHAINMKLEGHVKVGSLLPMMGIPAIGNRIYFCLGNDDVLTSPVIAIIRPPKKIVAQYPPDK